MSRQPQEMEGFKAEIHAAFLACEASVPTLFARFQEEWFKLGLRVPRGAGMPAFRSWMEGRTEPNLTEYYFVAKALNNFLEENGNNHRLWEIQRPPSFAPRGDGDGASNQSVSSQESHTDTGGYRTAQSGLKSHRAA